MSVIYRRGVCLLAGLLLLTGCSGGGGGTDKSSAASAGSSPAVTEEAASAPKSGGEVRDLLAKGGLPCTNVETVTRDKRAMGSENAADFERCEVDGEKVNINVWKDSGQLENWEGFTKQVGCAMGKQFGVTNLDWVRGDLWSIDSISQTLADKIGAATGATPVHIKCE